LHKAIDPESVDTEQVFNVLQLHTMTG